MCKDLISIIVPVYNIENYISACVESLINQTYANLEILLVNDCSTDNSLLVCEELANIDKRIRVISNTHNSGVSTTRNNGIKAATGKYILFVDGDDLIDASLCEMAMDAIICNNADSVHWGYMKFTDGTDEIFYKKGPVMSTYSVVEQPQLITEFLPHFTISYNDLYCWFTSGRSFDEVIFNRKHPGYCYRYLMSRDIIVNNNIKFCENVNYGEDLIFISQYIICSPKMAIINEMPYLYRDRQGSSMHKKRSIKEKIASIEAKEQILRYVKKGDEKEILDLWQGQIVLIALNGARVHTLKEYRQFMKYTCMRKAISGISLKDAPFQYKVAIGLLKCRLITVYYLIIRILSKGGFQYER